MMRQRTASFKPRLEILEDRLCPSSYSITDLTPLAGSNYSTGNAINDSRLVAGNSTSGSYVAPVLWRMNAAGSAVPTALPEIYARAGEANGINNLGQVVGESSVDAAGTAHAVLWQADAGGNFAATDLGTLGTQPAGDFIYSEALAISNGSTSFPVQVVGDSMTQSVNFSFVRHAALWQKDPTTGAFVAHDLDPMAADSRALGVNSGGQVVGVAGGRAVLWQVDTAGNVVSTTDLGTFGGATSGAGAINDLGHAVGAAATKATDACGRPISDAFLWKNNVLTDLGTLGNDGSTARGINNADSVVGASGSANNSPFNNTCIPDYRATLWQNGTMTDLNKVIPTKSHWTLQVAEGINTTGSIVGTGLVGTGTSQTHGFLLIPPTTALTAATTTSGSTTHSSTPQATPPTAVPSAPSTTPSTLATDSVLANPTSAPAGTSTPTASAPSSSSNFSGWLAFQASVLGSIERDLSQWQAAMTQELSARVQTLDQLFADWGRAVLDPFESDPAGTRI